VVPVLDPHEKNVFDGMVNVLRQEDPKFLRKVNRLGRPRAKVRLGIAVLLWTIAPVCIVFGGWTGLLMAVVAAGYGALLVNRRGGMGVQPAGWPSPHRHPGSPTI